MIPCKVLDSPDYGCRERVRRALQNQGFRLEERAGTGPDDRLGLIRAVNPRLIDR